MRRRVALLGLSAAAVECSRAAHAGRGNPWKANDPRSHVEVDHSAWGSLLQRYCRPSRDGINRFAYAAMGREQLATLDGYLERMSATPVSTLSRANQLAFWVNLHNALAVRLVLDHYPVTSIREIGVNTGGPPADGAWASERIKVEGRGLSTGEIANGILRKLWSDARVNYVICCATLGAPNLPSSPLEPTMLDRHLDAAAIAFVNHPRGVSLPDGRLRASSLYAWHQSEFGGSQHAVIRHLMAYAAPQLAPQLRGRYRIDEYDYDWRLNDAPAES